MESYALVNMEKNFVEEGCVEEIKQESSVGMDLLFTSNRKESMEDGLKKYEKGMLDAAARAVPAVAPVFCLRRRRACSRCRNHGHDRSTCGRIPAGRFRPFSRICRNCGSPGHYTSTCGNAPACMFRTERSDSMGVDLGEVLHDTGNRLCKWHGLKETEKLERKYIKGS